ncbi:MAG: ABC transporter permease [Ilumatobacteraceae bacterium]|nr:ABC transporter permease [Ilumatobacteraceae bacterium]MCX6527391.1 ABC transporter permease [Actinomycetota bacterium]
MRYLVQRFLQFSLVFFIVTFGVMVLMRLGLNAPGDPARTMLGGTVSQELIDKITLQYHLDSNLISQYWYWLKGIIWDRDFGYSVQQNISVFTYMQPKILVTFFLGIYSLIWGLIIAVPVAVYQAYKRDSRFDKAGNLFSFFFISVPALVFSPFIIYIFVAKLKWFPRIGEKIYPWDDLAAHFQNFFLPVVVLSLPTAAVFARLLRSDMIATLQSDFITLANAKGVSPQRTLWVHALRNSLFSVLTSVGVQIGSLIGGALVVEQYFNMKGMGFLLISTILSKDLFVVQSLSAILVASVVFANLGIDLMYTVIDPRIRHARALL